MKNLTLIITLCLLGLTGNAQKVIEKNIDYKNQTIDLDVKFAYQIEIKTWDKSSVYLKADLTTTDGKYLEFYELDIDESNSRINIVEEAERVFKQFQEEWNKNNPKKKKRYYNSGCYDYEFNYTLYVPKNAELKVSSINGSLMSAIFEGDFKADLINGDIEIKTYSGDLDLSTINGAIDLKMINADLVAETIHGDIFADEKLKFDSENRHVGQKISGRTADGKNSLRLNTINGNMYLRL